MKFNFYPLLVFFILLISNISIGQLSEFQNKLSSKKINASIVDSYGLMWIATEEGLNMFDGKKVHVFTSVLSDKESLINSIVSRIIELETNDLLFVSKNGLSVFERDNFSFKRVNIPIPISVLYDKLDEILFVSTSNDGIYVLNNKYEVINHFRTDPLNPFSLSTNSFDIYGAQKTIKILNKNGDLIIATGDGINIFSKSKNSFERFLFKSEDIDERVNIISKVDENIFLLGFNSGFKIFDYYRKTFKEFNTLNQKHVNDILSFKNITDQGDDEFIVNNEENKNLVVARSFILTDDGLYSISFNDQYEIINYSKIYDNSKYNFEKLSLKNENFYVWGLNKNIILKYDLYGNLIDNYQGEFGLKNLCISDNENILTSTINGLFLTKSKANFIKDHEILDNQPFEDRTINFYERLGKNEVLLIDKFNIRLKIDETEIKKPLINYLSNNEIEKINENKIIYQKDRIFILTDSNIIEINTDGWRAKRYNLPKNIIFNKLKINLNKLFLSYNNGIYVFDILNKKFTNYKYDDLFNNLFPRGFSDIELVGKDLWVSNLETGLHVFPMANLNNPKIYSSDTINSKSISSYSIKKIKYDISSNRALISTQGDGLFLYTEKDSIFTQFKVDDGLLSNNIIDAEFGNNNNIWALSNKGLNYFNTNEDYVYEIDQTNGLDIIEYNDEGLLVNNFSIDSNQNQFENDVFGYDTESSQVELIEMVGGKKILSFNFDQIIFDDKDYNISLLSARSYLNNNDYQNINIKNGKLEIDSSIDFIELQMFTNNMYKRDQVEYFYKISSQSDEFISNGENNLIRLQSIPNYNSEIYIKAVNKSGVETANVFSFVLTKNPPLYQRFESIVAYIIIFILGIYAFLKWREKTTSKKLEDERRNQELEEARKLQNSLLPKKIPSRKEYDISVYLKSATEVGGDYYDFIENENNDLYAICGDATGHGVVSGIMVSVTKAGLNGINMDNPSKILNNLNSIVKRVNFGRLRMSLSVAKINNGSIELSSAAMPPTYYYDAKNNNVEEILVPNLPLGGIEGEKFDGVKKDFKKGDVVVMISDGLPELPNKEDVLLDYPKVFECIKNNCNESADEIKDALVRMSDSWADGLMNPDDITIVVIKKAS